MARPAPVTAGKSGSLRAMAIGLAVTAVLQSSTATGLMATSFAARGALGLAPALAGHRDVFTPKEGGNPVGATGSPLALETMALRRPRSCRH
jgi:hypothetical protein